jgi:D-3-phosphoglycerate dehydrogenase
MTAANVFLLPTDHALAAAVERAGGTVVNDVSQANVLMYSGYQPPELKLHLHAGLTWVQLAYAGVEDFEPLFGDGRIWTSSSGAFGPPIAEHVVALMLAAARNLHRYARATSWGDREHRSLAGTHACVIGAGGIGQATVRLLRGLGVEVTVLSRSMTRVPGATARSADELDRVLPVVDWLVLALPLTTQTRHLIGAKQFTLMRDHAWVINVARGGIIDTPALVAALESGQIGGAALDVTDPEPLPSTHRLWTLPNVLITPHCACPDVDSWRAIAARLEENVGRWRTDDRLVGQVSPEPSIAEEDR